MADQSDIDTRNTGELFSMDAADNAEVVPPHTPRGPDSMWSTDANDDDDLDDTVLGEPSEHWISSDATADPWDTFTRSAAAESGVFSAEPVSRHDDVLDADDPGSDTSAEPPWTSHASAGASVFASGPGRSPGADPWQEHVATDAGHRRDLDAEPAAARRTADPIPQAASDEYGLAAAVTRLTVEDQERSHVALTVAGALLQPGERVLGVVTGQMLGRAAAVVVTGIRVVVVNDRRWQPIVDIYPIDAELVVRGRHDRQVAALSFADSRRLSMVDGISDVRLAIELADTVRDVGSPDDRLSSTWDTGSGGSGQR